MPLRSEMMYPLEEDTSYLLLRGTSSHRERQSLCLLSEPKGVEFLSPYPPCYWVPKDGGFSVIAPAFGGAGGDPAPAHHYPHQGGLSPFQNCPSLPRIWLLRGFYAVGGSLIAPLPLDRPQNANTGQARTHLASPSPPACE